MRAVRCHELTGPTSLRIDEMPSPVPAAGEVRIDVKAAGVNFPDVLITQGKYQFKPPTPFSPGNEVAGIVSAVGDGVTDFAVGDRVAATMFFGAFAEQIVTSVKTVARLPEKVSFEVGASVLVTYGTTMHGLIDRARMKAGETLLVLGAAGGVGTAAVEIGKCMGARVIAAASTTEKLDYCKAHGADLVINYETEDLKERAKELSGGGVDVTYDAVGGKLSEAALRAMAWYGRHLVIGFAAGDIPRIPINLLLLKSCDLIGVFWGQFTQRDPAANRAHLEQVFAWIAEGKMNPHLDAVLPFTEATEALNKLSRREVKGKIVLVP
jgi:NADPH2:quinone reductase